MLDILKKTEIETLLSNKNILESKLLSDSFGISCFKLKVNDGKKYIVKYYNKKIKSFNAIRSEGKNLLYLNYHKKKFFPSIDISNDTYLIMSYINNNSVKPNETNNDLLDAIIDLHSFTNKIYGFEFNTQVGGLEKVNTKNSSWVDFFATNRLNYIFELICNNNPMEKSINDKISFLLKKISNFIPDNPEPRLLHGDLWEGNILFHNSKFVGFIDPGSFFGHNEMEVAYLRWFNPDFIDNFFLDKYNERIKLNKNYLDYEKVYQLYYCLMNVYLWDRSYIKNTKKILKELKI